MIRPFRFALLVVAALVLATLPVSAAATTLTGGAVTVKIPAGEMSPAFTFTNMTGVPICDLVISRSVGGYEINGCVVDDPQHADEDWDVDDNEDGALSTGPGNESSAAPGAGAGQEGGGGAALGHNDNTQPAADGKVRVQENGADADNESKCVGNNRNFQVTCKLSAAALDGDSLKIQPTNVRDANLCAFSDGLLGRNERCAITPDHTINTAFAAFGRDSGFVNSVTVRASGIDGAAFIVALESTPPGIVDLSSGTIFFEPPLNARDGLLLYGILNDYANLEIEVNGQRVTPIPIDPLDDRN